MERDHMAAMYAEPAEARRQRIAHYSLREQRPGHWSAECGCGWWQHGLRSLEHARAALDYHRRNSSTHLVPDV